jgi:hypothetical protein
MLCAVIAVGLYIQFGERYRDTVEERRAAARLAVRFDPESVTSLRIDTPAGLFTLEKTNDLWRITSPSPGSADANTVMRILDTLASLHRSTIITAEEQADLQLDPAQYGFQPPRAQVSLTAGNDRTTILIGRDAPGGDQLYIKQSDSADILVTRRDLLAALPASLLDLRDRRLFSSQPGRIKRIEIESRDRLLHASRTDDDQWNIDRPTAARGANATIRQWLDRLYEFRIADFIADSVAAASLYGFDEPLVQVSLSTDTKSPPQTLKIGRPADVNNTAYFALLVGQEAVFTVNQDVVDWLRSDTAQFRDNRVMPIPVPNIMFIQMTDGDMSLHLQLSTQSVWEVISPKRFAANDRKVQELLGAWSGARVESFYDPPLFPDQPHGITNSQRSILFSRTPPTGNGTTATVVTNGTGSATIEQELIMVIGLTNQAGNVYASSARDNTIVEISGDVLDTFSVNPLDYREPGVLAVDPAGIRRLTQRTGTMERSVERTNVLFRTVTAHATPDMEVIDTIMSLVTRLRALRFVEEDSRDLAAYGLDQPARQLIIGLSTGTAINRVLLFGSATATETYAMVQGGDVVFTLSNDVVEALMRPLTRLSALSEPPSESP